MSVGFTVDKATIDQRVGSLAWQLRSTFEQIAIVQAWLSGKSDADLVALGYTQDQNVDEPAILKSAFTDLANLGRVAHGQATQADANDFFFWASRLVGVQ